MTGAFDNIDILENWRQLCPDKDFGRLNDILTSVSQDEIRNMIPFFFNRSSAVRCMEESACLVIQAQLSTGFG